MQCSTGGQWYMNYFALNYHYLNYNAMLTWHWQQSFDDKFPFLQLNVVFGGETRGTWPALSVWVVSCTLACLLSCLASTTKLSVQSTGGCFIFYVCCQSRDIKYWHDMLPHYPQWEFWLFSGYPRSWQQIYIYSCVWWCGVVWQLISHVGRNTVRQWDSVWAPA